jgi:hypothetical protein
MADPRESGTPEKEIAVPPAAERVTLHLFDLHRVDRGEPAAARVQSPSDGS